MKYDRRGSWYLLTGAVLGIALGLFYSWVISPVEYVDAPPYALRADFKDEYRELVAAAYLYSNDLLRAEDRLKQLKDDEIAQSLAIQAQRALSEGHPEAEVQALGILAMAIGEGLPPIEASIAPNQVVETPLPVRSETPTPVINQPASSLEVLQTATSTITAIIPIPKATNTLRPTSTVKSTPTQGAVFALKEIRLVCNPDQVDPLIKVVIQDAAGQPVPSIEIRVTWDGGEDQFFTGLKPELGLGYADFLMNPEVVYSLMLIEGGNSVNDLTAAECQLDDGSRYWGSWQLTFTQP
jgi:hypothetical protein